MPRLRLALAALALGSARAALAAEGDVHLICPLVLAQQRIDVEEQRTEIALAEARLVAAERILGLVQRLHENDAIERIAYLAAKHDRDVAEVDLTRQRLIAKREQATLVQYETVCLPAGDGETERERAARREQAQRTFLQVECHRVGKDLAIAELDLAYFRELLDSARNLRANAAASVQDIIHAERDVEAARIRVEHHRLRVDRCIASGEAAG
ncbi:MAG TPA: hypothetical protein VD788_12330 [Candidatus Polarisedimenticolaceae bacterium]|nr:hypothetical protein [Candidatus Polarisedimenticolaceae bacterium]